MKFSGTSKSVSIIKNKLFRTLAIAGILFFAGTKSDAQTTIMSDYSQVFLDKLIQVAKENYPQPKTYQLRIDQAKVVLQREKLNWLDILSFSFIYNPNYTFNVLNPSYFQGIQVGLSFNLATTLQKPYNVKRTRQDLEISRLDQQTYLLSLETQVTNAYITYIQNLQLAKMQSTAYNNSLDSYNATEERYNKSEVTYDVWALAKNQLNAAAATKLSAEATLMISKRALEELLGGRKLEEVK